MTASAYYTPTRQEIHDGWLFGRMDQHGECSSAAVGARAALESIISDALQRGPCFVAFSGGRDSSAVLAVAVMLARRHGLPDPIAWTHVFPGVDDADESEWQARVLQHLRLERFERVDLRDDLDALGKPALEMRTRYGPLWPPVSWTMLRLMDAARGGTVLTGEGGDEVLDTRRMTYLNFVLARRGRVRRAVAVGAVRALAPRVLAERPRAHLSLAPSWLRPDARERYAAASMADARRVPLRWDRETIDSARVRAVRVGLRNLDVVAADRGARLVHPLLEARFVTAFAAEGGRLGLLGRTAAMRHLVGDLLPEEVQRRTSKASFGAVVFGERVRAFARAWDGRGVDQDLVDPEELRRVWLSPRPRPTSVSLLQHAYAHSEGG